MWTLTIARVLRMGLLGTLLLASPLISGSPPIAPVFAALPKETAQERDAITLDDAIAQYYQADFLQAIELFTAVIAQARQHNDPVALAEALTYLGWLYGDLSRTAEAEAALTEALQIYQDRRDRQGEGRALAAFANLRLNQEEESAAGEVLEAALTLNRETGDRWGEGRTLNSLGVLQATQADYTAAIATLEAARAAHQAAANPRDEALAIALLGWSYAGRGDMAQAETLLTQARTQSQATANRIAEWVALYFGGILALSQGQLAQAQDLQTAALAIAAESGDDTSHALTLSMLGLIAQAQGNPEAAIAAYEQARQLYDAIGSTDENFADVLTQLAGVYYQQGQYDWIEPLLQQALQIQQTRQGAESLAVATILQYLGGLYLFQGRLQEAETTYQKVLDLRYKLLGEEHTEIATTLNNLALLYQRQGRYTEAETTYKQALAMLRRLLGDTHADVAVALTNLADVSQRQGKLKLAEELYQEGIAILEVQEAESSRMALTLNNLGLLYLTQGKYTEAKALFERSLAMLKTTLSAEHPDVAISLSNLGFLAQSQGNYAEAAEFFQQSLAILQQVFGDAHPDIATGMINLGRLYQDQGQYAEAEPRFQDALVMLRQILGPEHPDVASVLNALGLLYQYQGRFAESERYFEEALAMNKKLLAPNHPSVADNLNSFALLYVEQGRYPEAEELYQQSLTINRQLFGSEHPAIATGLANLALVYAHQGRLAEAEQLTQESLALRRQLLGPEHPDIAVSLNNLAFLYQHQERYTEAEEFYRQTLDILQKQFGTQHPVIATNLTNLADLYQLQGRHNEAEPLYQQALEIRRALLGPEHPDVALNLNNLGLLYKNQGRYAEAAPLFQEALQLLQTALGAEHPKVATNLGNLALLNWSLGQLDRALDYLEQGLAIQEANLARLIQSGSERQKSSYFSTIRNANDAAIAFNLHAAPENLEAGRLALTTVLRRKGRVLDAVTDNVTALRQNLTPQAQALLNELNTARSQLAALIFDPPVTVTTDYQTQVAALKGEIDRLEAQIARDSAEFRVQTAPIEIATIQAEIPADAALIEFVQYRTLNPSPPPGSTVADQWGEAQYAAYILRATGEPQWVDLGPAAAIDAQIRTVQRRLQSTTHNVESRLFPDAQALYQMVMEPVLDKVGEETPHLLISPDAQLNLIPFAALVNPEGEYLLEHYQITYLTSGRDLLRYQTRIPSQQAPLILADIDYDASETTAEGAIASNRRSADLRGQFLPLENTAIEGEAIAQLLDSAQLLTGDRATERAVKAVQGPEILHIATHGFFLDLEQVAPADYTSQLIRGNLPLEAPATPTQENPLLRSGLALAGYNERQSGAEDGVLTALEVAGLNLYGTQLAVLSACETGTGEIANGEGVYGLRRALVIAGSESQIISLWQVDDAATKDLMVKYYAQLQAGEGRSAALRQVQLELLASENYQAPYFWAAFIPSGNWRSL